MPKEIDVENENEDVSFGGVEVEVFKKSNVVKVSGQTPNCIVMLTKGHPFTLSSRRGEGVVLNEQIINSNITEEQFENLLDCILASLMNLK